MVAPNQVLTVSQLNLFIKDILGQIPILGDIQIRGEISNFKHHSSGHMYMSLKDATGVLRAVMFRTSAMTLKFIPKDGMQVVARGRISVYERDGQYQLYINSMEQDGKGDLYRRFEELKAKLQAEGLFSPEHKKAIPQYPKRIGVITAPTGAAVRDIINIISRRYPACDICLYPSLVQGDGAAQSVIKGIEYFNATNSADVLIVGRGGGSIEDLWAFNEESLARAIFASEIPIISAVGHETDFTISDFVSDLRAPTPSAAAELAVPSVDELYDRIKGFEVQLKNSCTRIIENKRLLLKRYSEQRVLRDPVSIIAEKGIYVDHLSKMLEVAAKGILKGKENELGICASKLQGLSPLNTLARGYSVVRGQGGEVLSTVKDAKNAGEVKITLTDGTVDAVVK